jgi:beta-lactamase regulating signal transducer with metallopeptidase domain
MMLELLRSLLALTLVSSASVVIVLSVRRGIRRAFGASVSYSAWFLVPISMLALFVPGARDTGYELVIQAQMSPVSSLVTQSFTAPLGGPLSVNWQTGLVVTWGVGAGLFIAYFIGLQRAFVRGLGTLSDFNGGLRARTAAGCPALIGILKPKIVLPADFETRYTAQEQSLILAHENVHLRRQDTSWNALTALLRCVLWFNPLIHFAASRMRVDQELACDAAVIERHPASRRAYAGAMLKTQLADAALPVGCHWTSTHPFKERLEMIKTEIPTRGRRALGAGLLAAVSMAVGYAAWAAEPALTAPESGAQPIERAPLHRIEIRQGSRDEGLSAELTQHKGSAKLSGNLPLRMSANTVTPGPNGQQILEGNARVDIPRPGGAPDKVTRMHKSPTGEVTTESVPAPKNVTVTAEKIVVTQLADGNVQLDWDDGRIEEN